MKTRNILSGLLIAALAAGASHALFRPKPLVVEVAKVQRAPLRVTVEEEGRTRMHDHFTIAAPVSGKTRRIELHSGDTVRPGEIVAWMDPSPIDPRQSAMLEARLQAAPAAERQSEALMAKASSDYEQAHRDAARSRSLWEQELISQEAFERAVTSDRGAEEQVAQASASLKVTSFQAEEAKAALLMFRETGSNVPTPIRTPVEGRVLRLIEQSERVVAPGTPLIEIGYTPHLEIVADFLTRAAAQMHPGLPALITDYGGDTALPAHVTSVEPGGFTKVSALGVEEQRVNVILDFDQAPSFLQDGFHVLGVGRASILLSILDWEVTGGVAPGSEAILHPAADVTDGAPVRPV